MISSKQIVMDELDAQVVVCVFSTDLAGKPQALLIVAIVWREIKAKFLSCGLLDGLHGTLHDLHCTCATCT